MGKKADVKVRNFIKKVRKVLNVDLAILFGSRARGDYLEDSDYDVLIVSRDFKGKIVERISALYDYWDYFPLDIEVLCYTPEEFEKMKGRIGIVQEALKEGIEIS